MGQSLSKLGAKSPACRLSPLIARLSVEGQKIECSKSPTKASARESSGGLAFESLPDIGGPSPGFRARFEGLCSYNESMDASPRQPDAALESLRRQRRAEGDNPGLLARYHSVLRRTLHAAPMDILFKLDLWDQASDNAQDLVIAEVDDALPDFECVAVERYECGSQGHRIASFRHKASAIDFQLLPGGHFQMGQRPGEELEALAFYRLWEHFNPTSEQPQHPVTIERPFLLARFPLTEASVKGERGGLDSSLPLENLSWAEAGRRLRGIDRRFVMPSEAQWEYACRAQSPGEPQTIFYWGDDLDRDYLWYGGNSDFRRHSFSEHREKGNAFGLVDMLGNTREWCLDIFQPDYQNAPSNERPQRAVREQRATRTAFPRRASPQASRVMRGGAWNSDAGECRCASRDFRFRRYRQSGAGVRPSFLPPLKP